MKCHKIISFWFVFLITLVTCAQTIDTSKHVFDQNPNFQKTKNKYTKKEITPTITTVALQPISKYNDSTIINYLPATLAQEKTTIQSLQNKLKLAEKKNDQLGVASAFNDIGFYYWNAKNLKLALDNYQRSLKIYESVKNKLGVLEPLNGIGGIYALKKDEVKAEEYYTRSLKIAKELNISEKIKLASNALSKIYANEGNYKNAFEMQLLLKQVTDSLYKKETENALIKNGYNKQHLLDSIKQMEDKKLYLKGISGKQLEVDHTQKMTYLISIGLVLALLLAFSFYRGFRHTQKTNKLIANQKRETEEKKIIIEKSLQEKEILLKEIHHRVKNNLQIISSLLSLQANRTEDEELKKTMTEAKNRISSMALIHQKIYQSDNLSSIDFQSYIEQMTSFIDGNFNTEQKTIIYEINTNGIVLDIDTAIPLGLIINELLTNIHKYAFKNKASGKVNISLTERSNDEIEFHISDNGVGIPKELQINSLKSLGLKLVKGLTDQIKGTFKFENNNGAHFFINFKKY